MWELYRTREIKSSRKAHTCDECGRRIEAGQPYRQWAGRFEGDFMSGAVHGDCQDWANCVLLDTGDGRPLLGDAELDEDVDMDALSSNPPPAAVVARLPPAWRRLLVAEVQP